MALSEFQPTTHQGVVHEDAQLDGLQATRSAQGVGALEGGVVQLPAHGVAPGHTERTALHVLLREVVVS